MLCLGHCEFFPGLQILIPASGVIMSRLVASVHVSLQDATRLLVRGGWVFCLGEILLHGMALFRHLSASSDRGGIVGPGSVGSSCIGGPAHNLPWIDKVDDNGGKLGTEGMSRHIKETGKDDPDNLSSYAH